MGRAKFKTIPTDFESAAALKGKTIAYATTVTRPSELEADVLQHGNVIATYTPEALMLDTCGYDTVSTSHRLDILLTAYLGTFQSWRVAISDFEAVIRPQDRSVPAIPLRRVRVTPDGALEIVTPDGTVIA